MLIAQEQSEIFALTEDDYTKAKIEIFLTRQPPIMISVFLSEVEYSQ